MFCDKTGKRCVCIHVKKSFFKPSALVLAPLYLQPESKTVSNNPVKLAIIAILTPPIRMSIAFSKLASLILGIANKPMTIPNIVPIKPKYKGMGNNVFISSSIASVFRSTTSLIKLKSLTAPLLRNK